MRKVLGVDGTSSGWVSVEFRDNQLYGSSFYSNIRDLYTSNSTADQILIDIPIGLRESCGDPRKCDELAREKLSPTRHSSVYPVPVREVVRNHHDYEMAKKIQENKTDKSLSVQSWAISDKINEVDKFMQENPKSRNTLRESHPELCFWAFNDRRPMEFSKTSEPKKALKERMKVLKSINNEAEEIIRENSKKFLRKISKDDLVDALALAISGSTLTGPIRTLPENPAYDPTGLPMEIAYSFRKD